MAENFANDYATTLSSGIDASTTSLTVASATGAPAANFRLRIDNELLLVTNVSGTTFTVTRGVEGTTAASHSSAAVVTHVLTAAGLAAAFEQPGVAATITADRTFQGQLIETPVTANTGTGYTVTDRSMHDLTLTGNCTFTFPTNTTGKQFTLLLKQDGTGSRTVTWPSSVRWAAGTAPTITATASKTDVISFIADGTYWLGFVGGQNYTRA